jgi:hypothetical protein
MADQEPTHSTISHVDQILTLQQVVANPEDKFLAGRLLPGVPAN